MSTTAAVTPTITATIAPKTKSFSSPVVIKVYDAAMADGRRTTMPAKMISEMPFPMPFSEICSPIHIMRAVPAVSVTIVRRRNPQPGCGTIMTPVGLDIPSSP